MLRTSLCALALVAASVTALPAQQLSPEQQQVVDHIKMCWDAWIAAQAEETPDRFYEKCQQDEHALLWWTEDGAPQGRDWVYRNWQRWSEIDVDWADLRPVAVNIFGDVAIVYLYGY